MIWIFIVILHLPSFGGEVKAIVSTTSYESCEKLRHTVVDQFGGEQNINGTVSKCTFSQM